MSSTEAEPEAAGELRRESVIACEGYDDRAFWKGWLCRLGCTDIYESSGRRPVIDPWAFLSGAASTRLGRSPAPSSALCRAWARKRCFPGPGQG